MRLILECHSQVECWDERLSYLVMAGRYRPRPERALVGLKVPCLTEQLLDKTIWDPLLLPRATNRYRGQPVIFLVRDVRDVVASMATLEMGRRPWLELCLEPTVRLKLAGDGPFAARYGEAFARAASAGRPALARAAVYWRYKNAALTDYLAHRLPVLPVRYEDLVTGPRTEIQRVCDFLRLPWEEGMLDHPMRRHGELEADGLAIGRTDPSRAIDSRSVGRWRCRFGAAEEADILQFAGEVGNA